MPVPNISLSIDDYDKLDCMKCGACCHSLLPYEVQPGENIPESLTLPTALGYRVMDTVGTACIALGDDMLCKIYGNRPSVCERIQKGSDHCLLARKRARLMQEHVVQLGIERLNPKGYMPDERPTTSQ